MIIKKEPKLVVIDSDFTLTKYVGKTKGSVAKVNIEEDTDIEDIKEVIEEFRISEEVITNKRA